MGSFRELLEKTGTPAEKAVWNNAVRVTEEEKQRLIAHLTFNCATRENKAAMTQVYNRMTPEDLRALAATVPTSMNQPVNNSYGSGSMYVDNPTFTPVQNGLHQNGLHQNGLAPVQQQYPQYLGAAGGPVGQVAQVTPQQEIPSQSVQNGLHQNGQVNNETHSNILPLPSMTYEYSGKSARRKQG